MIKTIMAHIPTERPIRPIIDFSISLASTCKASIDAIAIGYISTSTYVINGSSGAAMAAVFEIEQEKANERAVAALTVFETEARHASVSYQCRPIVDLPGEAAASIGAASRLHDLSVVLQTEAGKHTFDDTISTAILFQSGGPVLFVPYIFRGVFKPRRIGVCWDGSRSAARALRDAGPLLMQADSLSVISVNPDRWAPSDPSPEQVVKYLTRYDHPVRCIRSEEARSNIQPSILSRATDENLDMLIMGAYGHSRLQEHVLGGVTREMLETMTIPTLMSH